MKLFKHTILLISLSVLNTYAYEPPIGIPDPGNEWGSLHPIDDVAPRPQNWNQEISGYYYVDATSPDATNSDNTYGYPDRPRSSLPSSVGPGSYVEVAGTYDSRISVNWTCTEAAPCWLRGSSADNPTSLPGGLSTSAAWVFIENFEFSGGTGGTVSIGGDSHHVVFRNSRMTNKQQPQGNSNGIGILPGNGQTVENIVIYGNHLENLGDWTVTEDLDFHGINPTLWGRDSSAELKNLWILNNYCTHLSGDCVQVNAGNWTNSHQYLHHIYIGHNRSYQNRQSGFWVKQGSDVIISQNESWGSDGNGGANAGSAAGMQYEKDNVWFIFNDLHDSVFGIRQSSTETDVNGKVYIIGNRIYNIRPAAGQAYDPSDPWSQGAAIALWHGNLDRFIVDNTMHNIYDGVTAVYNGGVEMYGNIISQKDDNRDNHFFDITHPARSDNVKMDYNLFMDELTESYVTWWNNVGIVDSLDRIISVSGGECGNCIAEIGESGSSHFMGVDHNDFRLKAGSSAIRANRKHPAYDAFQARYGINIYVDYQGNPRSSVTPSIGAFEFDSSLSRPQKMEPPTIN